MRSFLSLLSVIMLTLQLGCGGSSGSDDPPPDDTGTIPPTDAPVAIEKYFPDNILVVSPTAVSEESQGAKQTKSSHKTPQYLNSLERINALLSGDIPVLDAFEPQLFFSMDFNANCYGPSMFYDNHPDGVTPPPPPDAPYPSLPGGDLGIWQELGIYDQACASAQLNARMKGIGDQNLMALMSIASLISVAVDNGTSWPEDVSPGSTLDLTSQMNAVGITAVTFSQANISQSTSGNNWHYQLVFSFTRETEELNIGVNLNHQATDSDAVYEGLLTFQVDDLTDGAGNCSTTEVTRNGSLHYISDSATEVRLQYRSAQLCGHGTSGLTESVSSDNISGNVLSRSSNWANNFSLFTAEFNPENQLGLYTFAWQAGPNDGNTRVLNVGLEAVNNDGQVTGESYFGYGDAIDVTNGSIQGFICNWAGPGNNHTLLQYAQRQHLTQNLSSGWFEPSNSAASDITYAPTNSCTYDGSGSFLYDRDLDNELTDETSDTVNVGEGQVIELDMMSPSGDATTIWEHITNNRGFNLPDYP